MVVICLSGVHGCGKSTLIEAYKTKYPEPAITAVYSKAGQVYAAHGYKASEDMTFTTRAFLQSEVLKTWTDDVLEARKAGADIILTDRCSLDHYTYLMCDVMRDIDPSMDMFINSFRTSVILSLKMIDHILYISPHGIPLADRGSAKAKNSSYDDHYQYVMIGALSTLAKEKVTWVDTPSLEDRVTILHDTIFKT